MAVYESTALEKSRQCNWHGGLQPSVSFGEAAFCWGRSSPVDPSLPFPASAPPHLPRSCHLPPGHQALDTTPLAELAVYGELARRVVVQTCDAPRLRKVPLIRNHEPKPKRNLKILQVELGQLHRPFIHPNFPFDSTGIQHRIAMAPPEVVDDTDGRHSSRCTSPRWNDRVAHIARTANMEDQDDVDQEQRLINEGVYCQSTACRATLDLTAFQNIRSGRRTVHFFTTCFSGRFTATTTPSQNALTTASIAARHSNGRPSRHSGSRTLRTYHKPRRPGTVC